MTTTESSSVPEVAVVYGAAAIAWLGLSMWGLFGDCAPGQVDGQCGMSTAFGGLYGIGAAFLIIGAGRAIGIPRHFSGPGNRRWVAAATAFGACLAAFYVGELVAIALDPSISIREFVGRDIRSFVGLAMLTTFLGAPYAFAIVCFVAAMMYPRGRRPGAVVAILTCGVAAAAGMLAGSILATRFGYAGHERVWILSDGAWAGVVAAWVFWRVVIREQVQLEISANVRERA